MIKIIALLCGNKKIFIEVMIRLSSLVLIDCYLFVLILTDLGGFGSSVGSLLTPKGINNE